MQNFRFTMATATLALLWLAGCAAPTAGKPRSVALIMSGDFMSYSTQGVGNRVSVVDIDGKPVTEPYGPVELAPGRHTINIACDGANTSHTLTVAAGEVYQFTARTRPGAKGCTGALARVRSTNP
jgi:hypothetical protein